MFKNVVVLLVTLASFNLLAATFFVHNPEVSENEKSFDKTLKTLIIQSLENKKHQITNDSKASLSLKSTLLKLGDSYILTISKHSPTGVNSEKMKVKQIDDLDVVVDRVVAAVLSETTAKETLKIDTVTEQEKGRQTKRIEVTRQWMVGLGPVWLVNLGSTSAYNFVIGYVWGLDHNFDLNVKMDFSNAEGSSEAGTSLFTVGGNYFFNNDIHALYATADLGYGNAENVNKKEKSGWVSSLGTGMKFFRASSVNFAVEARYSTLFAKIENKTPSQFGFKVIVFF
ncbi:MAG: hypothetical protein A2381_20265 [Bdellovibrionales bacterium RIFOXYB1_FULL_37_110]|nr:MAG: hypothetical protein A2181_03900 [Bdellovibrionales bacterium RIFOXYA1_FULL_38_20]OFZ51071.1 MAG: hypothetical protein A2417_20050 [Bdellovibrionales bacterium RIFOXYC1_FULL_37_79]OFZ60283.1 MAG: hypothetical protein A2381_20265 [Bdellovibrionales bacterium RIFOXYB1_FULL_37_110]OFZ63278.1 MAG: hypothetical protein A2577_01580 [Bdellovibrionales bacterium RIFOXYD1_FULL_36_51]